jgi:thioesterase domain-containing protein
MAEAPPRDWLEHSLQEIWEEVLGVPGIGIGTSFLAVGGDTALAARMLDRVQEMLEAAVTLETFLEEPTIERLAAAIDAAGPERLPPPAETFSPATGEAPGDEALFLVSDGSTFRLARALGRRQRTHLLPCVAVSRPVLESIEATAMDCLTTLRRQQPAGPYRLSGYCLGALVAFDMACRLEREGERVESLILIAPRPWSHRWLTRRSFHPVARLLGMTADREMKVFARLADQFLRWEGRLASYPGRARRWLGRPPREKLAVAGRKLARGLTHLAQRAVPTGRAPLLHPAVVSRRRRHQEEWPVYKRVNRVYVPGPYGGPITILWPEHDPRDRPGYPDAIWRNVASRVECAIVRGGHHTCLTRHVESLAVRVAECLRLAPGRPTETGAPGRRGS